MSDLLILIVDGSEIFEELDSWNLRYILEREENPRRIGTLIDFHSIELRASLKDSS